MREALDALDELRRDLIPELIARGVSLPEPKRDDADPEAYSGSSWKAACSRMSSLSRHSPVGNVWTKSRFAISLGFLRVQAVRQLSR